MLWLNLPFHIPASPESSVLVSSTCFPLLLVRKIPAHATTTCCPVAMAINCSLTSANSYSLKSFHVSLVCAGLSLILVLSESGDRPRLFSRQKSWLHWQIRRPQIFHYHYLHYFLFGIDKGRVILSSAFQYTFLKEKSATDFGWDYVSWEMKLSFSWLPT